MIEMRKYPQRNFPDAGNFPHMRSISLGMAAAGLILTAATQAQPLLLLDSAFIHGAQAETRPNAAFPLANPVPANWASPVNYAGGAAHFRLEILNKPTSAAIRYQPCLERGATRACATAQILSDSGATRTVYTWSLPLAQWTPAGFSWSTRPDRLILILQDAYGRPILPEGPGNPNPAWVGQPYVLLYYPMSVRFSAAVAAAGAAFPGWNGLIPTGIRGVDGRTRAGPGPSFRRGGQVWFTHGGLPAGRMLRDAVGRRSRAGKGGSHVD